MRGRPKKGSVVIPRENRFMIRMTEEFFNELQKNAEAKKMSINEYVRSSANNYIDFTKGEE